MDLPATKDQTDSLWRPDRRALTLGLVLTITLVGFESLAISTVMPIVAKELGDLELYGWVFSAFFLGSLIGIVVVGGAIDRGGLAVPFALGLGLFAIGLLIGGLSPSMPILVGARFLQGLGAGTIQPIAYVAIGRTLPESLRPRMFATLSTAWVLPGALTLGALHAIADVPPPADPARADARRGRLPLAIIVALGSGLLTVGLTTGLLVPTVVLSAAGLTLGIFALRRLTPPGTLVARPVLPAAILLRGVLTCAFFGVDAFVALTLVEWRGLSATEAGLALTAATISWTAGAWIQARGAARWPTHLFVRLGFAVTTAGLAGMLLVLDLDVPWPIAIVAFGIAGLGMGLAYSPLALIVLREASPEAQGTSTSALSLTDSLGTALGTGLTGALVAASLRMNDNPAAGLAAGFALAVLIGLGGLVLTGRLRPRTVPSASLAMASAPPQS